MVFFPKALFLVTIFKNKNKIHIQFFNRIFITNFQSFLIIFQEFAFFVQTREKLVHGLLNFWKYAKIIHYLQFLTEFTEMENDGASLIIIDQTALISIVCIQYVSFDIDFTAVTPIFTQRTIKFCIAK